MGRNDIQQASVGSPGNPTGLATFETFKAYMGYGDAEEDSNENDVMLFYKRKHIHGFGAISGRQDGYLERDLVSVCFDRNGPKSLESVFTPRFTLGTLSSSSIG
jgi:hypothetical protein